MSGPATHCANFKTIVTNNEAYVAKVRKLSLTAVQLLAVSSTDIQLERDMLYFKVNSVKLFVEREELQGYTNEQVDRKLGMFAALEESCEGYTSGGRTLCGSIYSAAKSSVTTLNNTYMLHTAKYLLW